MESSLVLESRNGGGAKEEAKEGDGKGSMGERDLNMYKSHFPRVST